MMEVRACLETRPGKMHNCFDKYFYKVYKFIFHELTLLPLYDMVTIDLNE